MLEAAVQAPLANAVVDPVAAEVALHTAVGGWGGPGGGGAGGWVLGFGGG